MKRMLAGVLVAALLLPLGACSARAATTVRYPKSIAAEDFEGQRARREQYPISPTFLDATNAFAYQTAGALLHAEENANFSPLSLYFALSALSLGAEGETQAQMLRLLGAKDAATLAEDGKGLYQHIFENNKVTKLKIANSLWMDERAGFREAYTKRIAEQFYASLHPVDLTLPKTMAAMQKWVREQTNGTLSPIIETTEDTRLILMNTIYFYDEWVSEFDEQATEQDTFYTADGEVTAQFMHHTDENRGAVRGAGFTRATRAYRGGGSMVLVLPEEGTTLESLLAQPDALRTLLESGEALAGDVRWRMPRFTLDATYKLTETLKALGMTDAFQPSQADFSAMAEEPLFVSYVQQDTHIDVSEKSTEASAVTIIAMSGGSAAPQAPTPTIEMNLNRPFLYAITAPGDAILFIGVCANPAA